MNSMKSEHESNWINCCGLKWILFSFSILWNSLIDDVYAWKKIYTKTFICCEIYSRILRVSLPIKRNVRWISIKMLQSRDFLIPAQDWKHSRQKDETNFKHNLFMTQHFFFFVSAAENWTCCCNDHKHSTSTFHLEDTFVLLLF